MKLSKTTPDLDETSSSSGLSQSNSEALLSGGGISNDTATAEKEPMNAPRKPGRARISFRAGLLSAGIVTAVAAGSIAGVGAVSAHGDSATKDALIDKIAADAGVDRSTIEASFSAHREGLKAERDEAKAAHLQGLVDDGTITADQKAALETKFEEMKAAKESLRDQDLTRAEIREAMEEAREEMKAWAEDAGINLETIRPEKGEGFGRRGHGRRGFHNNSADDTSEES